MDLKGAPPHRQDDAIQPSGNGKCGQAPSLSFAALGTTKGSSERARPSGSLLAEKGEIRRRRAAGSDGPEGVALLGTETGCPEPGSQEPPISVKR